MADFVADLRSIAEYCNFGETLDNMLRDQLVCGINHPKIQNRLLSEAKLTYEKAMELALSMEVAAKDLRLLQKPGTQTGMGVSQTETGSAGGVLSVRAKSEKTAVKPCYRCGKEGHAPSKCRFREAVCHKCKKRGHIKAACLGDAFKESSHTPPKKVHVVEEPTQATAGTESDSDDYPCIECQILRRNRCSCRSSWMESPSPWSWTQAQPTHWCRRQLSKSCGQTANCLPLM